MDKRRNGTFLPPNGQNITSKFAATVDSSSIDPICEGQRSLAALLRSLMRNDNDKSERTKECTSVCVRKVIKIEGNK